jgi:hypothetical protein
MIVADIATDLVKVENGAASGSGCASSTDRR